MRIQSWNVNGLLSKVRADAFAPLLERNPAVICVQEVRTKQTPEVAPGWHHAYNPSLLNCGNSGTLTLSSAPPDEVLLGFGDPALDAEGRAVTTVHGSFAIVNAYVPHTDGGLRRQAWRAEWDAALAEHAAALADELPTIVCGDFNAVADTVLDIYEQNPHWAGEAAGLPSDERSLIAALEDAGFTDCWRALHPGERGYTWWSQRRNRRAVGRGWRIDYFFASEGAVHAVKAAEHLENVTASDHCPIELEVAL